MTKRIKCPWCGAATEKTAEKKCQPKQDVTGDYYCPFESVKTDKEGYFITDQGKDRP